MPHIELSAPLRVDGRPVSPQSAWLLLRLWVVATGADPHSPGWLRAAEVREHFARARSNPRMLVSRAFADFARWGIRVGWGTQVDRPLSMLSLAGRSRGPFWLAPGEVHRIRITLEGQDATAGDVLQWLDVPGPAPADAATLADGQDAAYWHAWGGAKADMQRGRLMVAGGEGALGGYRNAQALAGDAYGAALALLQQAMVWRRAGNADARWALLFQHHPRVRCEASAARQLADVDAGHVQVDALQRANLLLEVAWYEAHQGDLARAAQAATRLRRRLRELMPVDREFFRAALRRLPELGKP